MTGVPDPQLVRSDWSPVDTTAIDGVVAFQMANVLTMSGVLTETWRADWTLDDAGVDQVFQRTLDVGGLSAWHVHHRTTDRLFCAVGRLRVALFDARVDSPTHGAVASFLLGEQRPAVISVPPGVFHGVQNVGTTPVVLINVVDVAYDYEDPDHHRLPADTAEIPFTW